MKIILIAILCLFLLLGLWQGCQAVELLIKDYPTISGQTLTGESGLPEVIKYIYLFGLGAAGFVALLAILIGAIMYVFSAGRPDKAKDAKDRILSALLGILILLASVLILRTINPDLINIGLTLEEIKPVSTGEETQWYCHGCCGSGCDIGLYGCKALGAMTASQAIALCEEQIDAECGLDTHWSEARTLPCPKDMLCIIKNASGCSKWYDFNCQSNKEECEAYCKNRATELGGEFDKCKIYPSEQTCQEAAVGCKD